VILVREYLKDHPFIYGHVLAFTKQENRGCGPEEYSRPGRHYACADRGASTLFLLHRIPQGNEIAIRRTHLIYTEVELASAAHTALFLSRHNRPENRRTLWYDHRIANLDAFCYGQLDRLTFIGCCGRNCLLQPAGDFRTIWHRQLPEGHVCNQGSTPKPHT
jgi:hypothetical protein